MDSCVYYASAIYTVVFILVLAISPLRTMIINKIITMDMFTYVLFIYAAQLMYVLLGFCDPNESDESRIRQL